MPYGIPAIHGGDSAENIRKMKSCMESVARQQPTLTEESLIRICKSSLFGEKEETENAEEEGM